MYLSQFQNIDYALIVANGQMVSDDLISFLMGNAKYILAADGGANHLLEKNLKPDGILGDFDSIDHKLLSKIENSKIEIIEKKSQEKNDLEKSILFLLECGYKNIIITSIHGRRDDHNFAAYQIMKKYRDKVRIIIFTDHSEIMLLSKGIYTIETEINGLISLFGFPRAYGIKTTGLKYQLRNENLFETSRGISNNSLLEKISIEIGRGNLLVFRNLRKNG